MAAELPLKAQDTAHHFSPAEVDALLRKQRPPNMTPDENATFELCQEPTRAETPRQTVLPPWGCSVLLLGFLDKGVSQPSSWNSMLLLKFKGGVGQP